MHLLEEHLILQRLGRVEESVISSSGQEHVLVSAASQDTSHHQQETETLHNILHYYIFELISYVE